MEDKRVGKSNRSKAICITVIVLLCIGLTGLFLMEYRSGNTNRKQKGSKNRTNGIKLRKSHITEMWCGIFFAINY